MSSVTVCLGYTGSIVGIIQSIIWTILALCAILIRYEAWVPVFSDLTHSVALCKAIYDQYVAAKPEVVLSDLVVTPNVFTYWIFVYLVLSAAWCIISMWLFYVIRRNKRRFYKTIFPIWSGCTCTISLLDLTLVILLAIDYSKMIKAFNSEQGDANVYNINSVLAIAILMTIAARGFVLWLVNVIIAIALVVVHYCKKEEGSELLREHINAYETNSYGKQNYGFDWSFEKSDTKGNSLEEVYNTSTFSQATTQTANEPLAKIGKARGTTTPTKVLLPQPPHTFLHPRVPSPDYSPILERKNGPTKSALKTRTQNVYGTQF